jgi:dihydropteroate synthase-like protein
MLKNIIIYSEMNEKLGDKMKILIITGTIAEQNIIKHVKNYEKHELYIKTLPIPIAAFTTPKLVIYNLNKTTSFKSINTKKECKLNEIDMIITPGLMKQDAKIIQKQLNIPTFKGSTNSADIKLTLDILDDMELSTTTPADVLIRNKQYEESMKIINKYNARDSFTEDMLKEDCNILIGDCPTGLDFPMRVLGEIANATSYSDDELLNKVEYYIKSEADMIDIGMTAGENNPDKAHHMIKLIKDNYNIPLSIDSINPDEIKRGLEAGADLVLSVDHGNYDKVISDIKDYDANAVMIPTDYSRNYIPSTAKQRVESLEKLDKKCEDITTIADLLLDPVNSPSLINSLEAYSLYRKRNPSKQMFFGVGNVSELLDADSNGVHAVLAAIAMELDINILFTPEASLKTKNAIRELKTASNMMFIAKYKESIPKNIGINLIQFKDAYKKDDATISTEGLEKIEAYGDGKFIPDKKGSFKIVVDDGYIKAIYYVNYEKTSVIYGKCARDIYEEILRRDMISRLEHAAYMGMELQKAETALKLDKQYVQDFPIF